jgi:methylmalonyl-CoA mutase
LTDLVEEAVYAEFERLSERGGVLGAMDTMYQRGRIQDESLLYETRKHDGSLPIVGVNTLVAAEDPTTRSDARAAAPSTRRRTQMRARARSRTGMRMRDRPRWPSCSGSPGPRNVRQLMDVVKVASLGRSLTLYEVGGEYWRKCEQSDRRVARQWTGHYGEEPSRRWSPSRR